MSEGRENDHPFGHPFGHLIGHLIGRIIGYFGYFSLTGAEYKIIICDQSATIGAVTNADVHHIERSAEL